MSFSSSPGPPVVLSLGCRPASGFKLLALSERIHANRIQPWRLVWYRFASVTKRAFCSGRTVSTIRVESAAILSLPIPSLPLVSVLSLYARHRFTAVSKL